MADERLHDVVEERPAAHLRQLLDVQEVVRRRRPVASAICMKPWFRSARTSAKLERGLVVHDVGDHRAAVVVALHGAGAVGMEALRRPAAAARVHRLVEQAAELACSASVGSAPALARSKPSTQMRSGATGTYGQHVHRLRPAVDAVEELRDSVTQSHGRPCRIDS